MGDWLEVQVLSSGSQGNAVLYTCPEGRVLVDAGVSRPELIRRLRAVGTRAEDLDAILLTHCHLDHARSAGTMARRFKTRVYATPRCSERLGKRMIPGLTIFEPGSCVEIVGLRLRSFLVEHDAPETVGFRIEREDWAVGHCTDLGSIGGAVTSILRDCEVLYLEFNHDREMLREGPYTPELKRRILSPKGHLSNEQAAALLAQIATPKLEALFLAHLSQHNNDPGLALASARAALPTALRETVSLHIARQDEASEPCRLES